MSENWKQKLVAVVATVTVGGGVTAVAMKGFHSSPCSK
jgi:hypothetical protein